MKTIWKYKLQLTDSQQLWLPKGAQLLTVQMQDGAPCLWALVDIKAEGAPEPAGNKPGEVKAGWKRREDSWIIYVLGTGHPAPAQFTRDFYLGTVQMLDGSLVWHVFAHQGTEALPRG